jgi:hypothetical protein
VRIAICPLFVFVTCSEKSPDALTYMPDRLCPHPPAWTLNVPRAEACQFAIDELKARVPIWKRELYDDGSAWKENAEFHRSVV